MPSGAVEDSGDGGGPDSDLLKRARALASAANLVHDQLSSLSIAGGASGKKNKAKARQGPNNAGDPGGRSAGSINSTQTWEWRELPGQVYAIIGSNAVMTTADLRSHVKRCVNCK
jgi:hypothetical protein